jgi:hypothetical protein
VNDPLDAIVRRHAAIINEARATVAAGGELDTDALAERLVAAARRSAAQRSPEQSEAIAAAERAARSQLERLVGVQKAKKRLGAEQVAPSATARPAPALPGRLQTRPTITGNMDVRRGEEAGELSLSWQAEAAVSSWEVRFSERPRPGADYALLGTVTLAAETTTVAVPLGERIFRVSILGRGRDGRPRSRALISGLTRSSWGTRWERRASAS